MRLLLLLLLSLLLRPSLLRTRVASFCSLLTESSVGVLSTLGQVAGGDLADGVGDVRVVDGEGGVGLGDILALKDGLGVGLLGVTLLDLAGTAGEDDEAVEVLLQSLDVDLETLLGQIGAASVNADTDGGSVLAGDLGSLSRMSVIELLGLSPQIPTHLELSKRETTSGAQLHVVLDGRATNSWSELVDWTRSDLCGLCNTSIATSLLLARLFQHC